MSAVQQTQPTIQLLLSTGDFVAALDLISTTQEVLQLELGGIQSLRYCKYFTFHSVLLKSHLEKSSNKKITST